MGKDVEKTPMSVCVCGWYFYPEFMKQLTEIPYPVFVVSHRHKKIYYLQHIVIDNVGLEWGAYNYFLINIWDKKSHILFCHDDIVVSDPAVFDDIARINIGITFIFRDKRDELGNKGGEKYAAHGRAFFMRCYIAHMFYDRGGFWYDRNNFGDIKSSDANLGIKQFKKDLDQMGLNIGIAHYPQWNAAYRGRMKTITLLECDAKK